MLCRNHSRRSAHTDVPGRCLAALGCKPLVCKPGGWIPLDKVISPPAKIIDPVQPHSGRTKNAHYPIIRGGVVLFRWDSRLRAVKILK